MPGRNPGTHCTTGAPRIDQGTHCRTRSPRPGTLGGPTPAAPDIDRLNFGNLWAGYPAESPYLDERGNIPSGYENQCAIKLSLALLAAGVPLKGFRGASVAIGGRRAALRAKELAEWLTRQAPESLRLSSLDITGPDWEKRIKGVTGIVYFENYWLRPGEKTPSGDHIDLWNGQRLTASGLAGVLVTTLRFGLGVNSWVGFSDLGKSTRIVFWVVT